MVSITLIFVEVNHKIRNYTIEFDFLDEISDSDKGVFSLKKGLVKRGVAVMLISCNISGELSIINVGYKYKICWYF